MNRLGVLIVTVCALLFPALAPAQDYPTRAVTIVVPFTPGGATDMLARLIAQHLEKKFGKPFMIENKPGGGSVIGATSVAKATPDGYTLMMAPSGTMAVNPTMIKNLSYDPATEYVPLSLVAGTPFALVVNPSLPINSVADLVKYAKDRGGPMPFATVGPGIPHHLFAEMFKGMVGIQTSYVPYRGSVPALSDVIAGHVPVMFVDLGPAGPMITSGKVRALGVTTKDRVAAYPDIPPLGQAGVPGFEAMSWQMLVAPAKTPRPVVDKLHGEIKAFLATAEIRDHISKNGMVPMEERSVEGLQQFVKNEIARWGKVVTDAGIAGSQ
jgi:tripartite-type tricarboxylate transporter receptor subunit TctC